MNDQIAYKFNDPSDPFRPGPPPGTGSDPDNTPEIDDVSGPIIDPFDPEYPFDGIPSVKGMR